jgi:hypothetical protein
MDTAFGSACKHDIGIAILNKSSCVANCMCARRTSGCYCMIWTLLSIFAEPPPNLKPVPHREMPGSHIDK